MKTNSSFFIKWLDKVERFGNKLPNAATLFIILSFIIILVSHILYLQGTYISFYSFDSTTNSFTENNIYAVSLLSRNGIDFMVSSFVSNFVTFIPMGIVFVIMIGVAVADKSGLLETLLKKIAKSAHPKILTPLVIFLATISSVASAFGFAVWIPLSALLFISFGRHPIAGLTASFAGVAGAWAANVLIAPNDVVFAGLTQQAAHILDNSYYVLPTGNWFFMSVSTILITILGTWVTEKIVEPKLGKYENSQKKENVEISNLEKKGLKYAGISFLIYVCIVLALILPENGPLRNATTGGILVSPFMNGIVFFSMAMFLIPGLVYGIITKSIRSDHQVIKMIEESIKGIVDFLVLIFFASQFVAHFNFSNMGIIISINGANILENLGFVGLPLVISIIIVVSIIDLVFSVDTAKWAMMAPVFVPMLMMLGISPELTQLAYRIGDSTTNLISPLMPFFPMMLAFVQRYNKNAGIGTVISLMLPYTLTFLLGWILLLVVWFLLGIPLGPSVSLFY
ncbi:MAG: AbgT family transporter [Defluviitaleaceae bacterium]|nr:AbgT family transporter [Defluviitaleaceae bacterium]